MKNLLLLLFLCGQGLLSFAQIEFAPPGAVWHYGYTDYAQGAVFFNGYESVTYDRDTVIDNKACKILTRRRVGEVDHVVLDFALPEKIIYQEGFKIYSLYDDKFYKIYDFGVEEGDTVTLSGGNRYSDSCSVTFMIDSVYYEEINGQDIKNIKMKSLGGGSSFCLINEKFGALPSYLFAPELGCIFDLPRPNPFRCYQDSIFDLYKATNTPCDYYENVSKVIEIAQSNFQLSPNPISDFFQIKNESTSTYELQIYHLSGQLIHQSLEKGGVQEVDCSQWKAGTYIVQIKTGTQIAYKKIVKVKI